MTIYLTDDILYAQETACHYSIGESMDIFTEMTILQGRDIRSFSLPVTVSGVSVSRPNLGPDNLLPIKTKFVHVSYR